MSHPQPTKFCRDCQFRRTGSSHTWESWRCGNPLLNIPNINPVTGEPKKVVEHCISARLDPDLCSIEGKWWKSIGTMPDRVSEAPLVKRKLSGLTLDDL